MAEFGWKRKARRDQVAALLRRAADGLAEGTVELTDDAAALKVKVPEQVTLEVELGIEGDELELELELSWPLRETSSDKSHDTAGDDTASQTPKPQVPPNSGTV